MKKIMTIIAMGILCMCATSCSDVIEDAYMAEQYYKLYRAEGRADAALYKAEFMEYYQSMSESERERYKAYRKQMDEEARKFASMEKNIKAEAEQMLNE